MKYGFTNKQYSEILNILAGYPEIEKAVLFGSRAIGSWKEASDVDIAIYGEKTDIFLAARLKDHFEEETFLPFFFDIIAFNSIRSEELIEHIRDKGVMIYRKELGEWKDKTLGELIEAGNANLQTGPFGTMLNSSEYTMSGIPVIAVQDIGNNKLLHSKFVYVDDEVAERLSRYKVEENDIIFGRKGAVERRAIIKKNEAGWLQGSDCIRLRFDKAIHPKFISYQFGTNYYKEWMYQFSSGATMPSLNQQILKLLPIKLPPLPEQKAIASVLSSFDDKIDLLHRQNKTLEAMAETLFRQWFVEEAEDDWEEGCLGDIASFHNGKKRPDEVIGANIPIYGGNGILGYAEKYNYEGTTVIVGRVGAYCGSLYIEHSPVWVSDNALVAKPMNKRYSSFLFFLLKYLNLNELAEGSSHPLLTQTLLKSIIILMPPPEVVEAYIFQADTWLNKIDFNKAQIHTLEKLRDTLLPKLMSGEVRVKYDEKKVRSFARH